MKVLLTNDDGIRAPGINALHAALSGAFDELYTVADCTVSGATV
ncbi:MAG: 5'/3'-nucleotidase SurE, partial [Planctomycetota bacterium]